MYMRQDFTRPENKGLQLFLNITDNPPLLFNPGNPDGPGGPGGP